VIVASGAAVGALAPVESDEDWSEVEEMETYTDGSYGPTIPLNATLGDPTPLTESAYACPVTDSSDGKISGAVERHIPAATETNAADRIMIRQRRFPNGTAIPNRAKLVLDVPPNVTHLRSIADTSGAGTIEYERGDYLTGETFRFPLTTEWSDPGAFVFTFATENGTIHRYYASVCASDTVENGTAE